MIDIIQWIDSFDLSIFFEKITLFINFIIDGIANVIEGVLDIIDMLLGSFVRVMEYSLGFSSIVDTLVDTLPIIYVSVLIVLMISLAFFIFLKKVV